MPVTKAKKAEVLKELIDKFSRSKIVVFANYKGLEVNTLSKLRRALRQANAEFKVAKKTLIRLAAKENKLPEIADENMDGSIGATFSYQDDLAGLRILSQAAKGNEHLTVLGGIIDGKAVDKSVIRRYASIPTREVLLAKMLGSMQAPISGFYNVLHGSLAGFVRVVNAYKNTKPAEAVQAPAPVPAVAAVEVAAAAPSEPKPAETPPSVAS